MGLAAATLLGLAVALTAIAQQQGYSTISPNATTGSLFDLLNNQSIADQMAEYFFPMIPVEPPVVVRPLRVQSNLPDGKSLLAQKQPEVFARLEAMRLDFPSLLKADTSINPLYYLQEEADQMRAKANLPELSVNKEAMKFLLHNVLSSPRDSLVNEQYKNNVGSFLFGYFGTYGFVTNMQRLSMDSLRTTFKEPAFVFGQGTNVIGILPGTNWKKITDRPIVVGAHWDTLPWTPGYDDNGSGVMAMLEIATALMHAKCHKNEHTIIFVAFDAEETGCLGSLEFIRSFLLPDFTDQHIQIQGAFVIDSALNWDDSVDSQTIPESWEGTVPESVIDDIAANGHRGDFVGVISRKGNHGEEKMAARFSHYYSQLKARDTAKFKIQHFELSRMPLNRVPTSKEMIEHVSFWRSDHSRFWYHKSTPFRSFSSVLISDTAELRGVMRQCYHRECDSPTNPDMNADSGIEFLSLTAQALVLAIAEMSGGHEQCNFDHFVSSPPPQIEEVSSHSSSLSQSNEVFNQGSSSRLLDLLLQKLWESRHEVSENFQHDDDDALQYEKVRESSGIFHGPYLPNYGTQINIDHLTLVVEGANKEKSTTLNSTRDLYKSLNSTTTSSAGASSTSSTTKASVATTMYSTSSSTTTTTTTTISSVSTTLTTSLPRHFYYHLGVPSYNPSWLYPRRVK